MLIKLKNKEPASVRDGLFEAFFLRSNPEYPIKALLTDNGGEFKNDLMRDFCIERGCKQIFGLSHSPKSNNLVERTNGLIRNILSHFFIQNGTVKWVDLLEQVATIINDSVPEGYLYSRRDLYFYENDARGALEVETEKHKKDLRRTRAQQLQVGDHVRVELSQLQPQIRQKLKEGQQKYVNARFSLEVYTIVRVNKSRNRFLRDSYSVTDNDGVVLRTPFYSNQLKKVPDGTVGNDILTADIINKINGVR
jgi:transposase InsO family protein